MALLLQGPLLVADECEGTGRARELEFCVGEKNSTFWGAPERGLQSFSIKTPNSVNRICHKGGLLF